ncbi:UTP--glucose-1-phosphate uridylyltransferase [Pseudobdellovibrio exovorus]|nr:UTP--glucose-1-phosphate uridylyltransferase [Pseudobdellovibrio exovorus]
MNKNTKVTKAIIPAAGLGTRFFPATKTIPKEMLPIVDKPTILYVIEEAIQAGIEDIVLIQGRGKTAIEDFFDISYELEDKLVKDGKEDILQSIHQIRSSVNIISLRQKSALGLGHAVRCAKPVVGDESFAVLLGDEITLSQNRDHNVTAFLCDQYSSTQKSSVWVLPIDPKDSHKYGIVDVGPDKQNLASGKTVLGVVEKPATDKAPSHWALPGRYVFDAKIFDYLDKIEAGKNGEIQLSDAMNLLAQAGGLNAYSFDSRRYDAGDKLGFLIANVDLALEREDLREDLLQYLKGKLKL